jgi:hypothetical protein
VLILAMVLVGVLVLVATAFLILARLEARAATNSLRGAQAETAARAGLAAAIYQISATQQSCYGIDAGGGWHAHFYDAAGPDLCPDSWVQHYDATAPMRRMTARRRVLPRVEAGDPSAGNVKALKRARGFASEYYVAVADLDGKLRVNPKNWGTLIAADDAKLRAMLRCFLSTDALADKVRDRTLAVWSIGAMRAAYALADAGEMSEVEGFVTPYPRRLADLAPATSRPPVNINTARKEVLLALVLNVPGFDAGTLADDVAAKLIAKRPFADRREMEKALVELGQKAWNGPPSSLPAGYEAKDDVLTEQQLNDLLNSLAGDNSESVNESDLDRAAEAGVYTYDFDNSQSGDHTKGDHTVDGAGPVSSDYTWGTEVKFTSRFFHVYVMGRTVAEDAERRTLAERRLHAVYDALTRRVLWSRWHFYTRANMSD